MPRRKLYDVSQLDFGRVGYPLEEIRRVNPQRYEFEQLTAVLFVREDEHLAVGYRDVREDEFWTKGHMPGRPIFPGVLMLESAAQLCAFYCGKFVAGEGVFGFGSVDEARFRGIVTPGQRLVLVAKGRVVTPTRSQFETQGFVDGRLVFEATILGLRI
ncbi:MAG: 3-hydroxyacyl-ACP dehydratase FabZ family protein [Planctomycetota bacterium]